jgi:hypothetical protein
MSDGMPRLTRASFLASLLGPARTRNGISPVTIAEEKNRLVRQALIREIEAERRRPLVVMFQVPATEMDDEDLNILRDVISEFDGKPFDLLLETPGGYVDSAHSILEFLVNIDADFEAIVPRHAKSCGTLLSLAAKTLHVSASSQLGPIDPRIRDVPAHIYQNSGDSFRSHIGTQATAHMRRIALDAAGAGLLRNVPFGDRERIVDRLMSDETYPSHGWPIGPRQMRDLRFELTEYDESDWHWHKVKTLWNFYSLDAKIERIEKFFETSTRSYAIDVNRPHGDARAAT